VISALAHEPTSLPRLRSTAAVGATVVVANSLVIAEILHSPTPVGTAIAVAPGHAAVGHSSEPDDVVVFALEGDGPRVARERVSASG
jgi:hypothetical protein